MLESQITGKELIELLKEQDKDVFVIGTYNYGDYTGTNAVEALSSVSIQVLRKSAYSNTGYQIIDISEYEELENDIKVISLNEDLCFEIDDTMTVSDLENELKELNEEELQYPVVFASEYGDRNYTIQANFLNHELQHVKIKKSAYSSSGYAIDENNEGDIDDNFLSVS